MFFHRNSCRVYENSYFSRKFIKTGIKSLEIHKNRHTFLSNKVGPNGSKPILLFFQSFSYLKILIKPHFAIKNNNNFRGFFFSFLRLYLCFFFLNKASSRNLVRDSDLTTSKKYLLSKFSEDVFKITITCSLANIIIEIYFYRSLYTCYINNFQTQ